MFFCQNNKNERESFCDFCVVCMNKNRREPKYVLMFFCLKLNGTHSKRRDVIPWRLPTLWAPFGAFYFREHEFHEFHESQFAQVNFHAGKDLLIAYEFSRILPCGQKTGWHSCYLHAISKDISRMAIRVIREIRVLIITKFGNEQSE